MSDRYEERMRQGAWAESKHALNHWDGANKCFAWPEGWPPGVNKDDFIYHKEEGHRTATDTALEPALDPTAGLTPGQIAFRKAAGLLE